MAKPGRKKLYYWDTCAFIAWLNGGRGYPPEVVAGLDEIANEVNENKAILCTSVITHTEVLQGKLTPEQAAKLESLFKRRNVSAISVDGRIAQLASEIRNYYNLRGTKFSTPDSIHLATAIIYKVDELHTLDGGGKHQKANDMLRLNGNVAGHPLLIRVPIPIQLPLLAGVEPLPPAPPIQVISTPTISEIPASLPDDKREEPKTEVLPPPPAAPPGDSGRSDDAAGASPRPESKAPASEKPAGE